MNESKCNHLKSKTHKTFDEAIIRKFVILNPIFDQIDEIMKSYINIYNENYETFSVSFLLKLLTTTICVRHNRKNKNLNLAFLKFI